MNFQFFIFFLVFLLLGEHPLEGSPTSHQLPTFEEMSSQSSSDRKQYLNQLAKLINNKEYDFLDEIILTPGKKPEKHCFLGIYGMKSFIKSPHKNSRKDCRQNLKLAGSFFLDMNNKHLWEKFRIKLAILCLDLKKCQNFLKKQQKIRKRFFYKVK